MIWGLRTRWNPGVRARLLLAFFGISAFAVLAAAAGIYAFRQVGQRIVLVDARVPPTLTSLELSRSAERIIAAAPALLAATERTRRDEVIGELNAETDRLNRNLLDLKLDRAEVVALLEIEPLILSLTANLTELKDVVARRLAYNERIGSLRSQVIQSNDAVQRLLAPWLAVMDGQVSGLLQAPQTTEAGRLPALIQLQRATQTAHQHFSSAVDALNEASTTEQPRRLTVLSFQLGRTLRDLDATAANLDPKLTPLFLEQVTKLRELAEGPDSIPEARKQELGLVAEGEKRLAENVELSRKLAAAVDQLATVAKKDIADAISDALSVQRTSTRVLLALVGLSLLTSILIVWLYVGRNIVRRLTRLSEGTLAIASGRLHAPVAAIGNDEIAAMGRAVEIFRKNTLERDELLAEKAQVAMSLEQQVKQRTAELAQSVGELQALGEVSRAVNSTLDLDTVLSTIVAKATLLSGTDAGTIYVFDETREEFRLRANYGLDAAVIARIKDSRLRLGEGAVGKAAEQRAALQVPDSHDDPSGLVLDVVVRAGFRALLAVPLLGTDRIVGALVVRRKQPGEFPKSTIDLLQTFAAQSVAAIQNARLFDEMQAVARELRQREQDLTEKSTALAALSSKLAKYLAPQVYDSIFTGQQDVKIVTKRKKLTVCFSDLVGFTEITDQMESEDLTQLLNHYLTEMSKIALQHGATIDKYVGDAIVMFYGDPTTLGVKEDALACVQMTLAMQKRVAGLAEEWRNNGIETPLRCRIGIHTGYCTVGNFGSEDRMDYTMVGGTVNLASRLEHEAPPGGVLISFETYAHVKDEVRCEERGHLQVKGIAHPVATYVVLGAPEVTDDATAHLRLELDAERMTDDERRAAADKLRRALGLLEKAAK
jgi:class 3 adenylate cyclase/HAMP domain-containing protein/putative methionine-R-sulfoxide reductase with GAF domain